MKLFCYMSFTPDIFSHHCSKADSVHYDSGVNCFSNMEIRFTFGPLVVPPVIHDEIGEIHLRMFRRLLCFSQR